MRYILQDLCEMALVQADHDWNQVKRFFRWLRIRYVELTFGVVGILLVVLAVMEIVCWIMLKQQNAQLAELAQMMR